MEEAERLILHGLESSGQNNTLLSTHWDILMAAHRYEEAEALIRQLQKQFGDALPEALERNFNYQLGMIAMIRGDYPRARQLLLAAISEEDQPTYSGRDVAAVTLASLALERVGNSDEASALLDNAERLIKRGRLNGVDDPGIYYNEAVMLAMRDQPAQAMEKLREAYEHGFREQWVLEIDTRLSPLHDKPEFTSLVERIREDLSEARIEIRSLAVAAL